MPNESKRLRIREKLIKGQSDDPRNGNPLWLGVKFASDDEQLLKGRRQVAINDNIVKQMAIMKFDPLATAGHFGQFVIGETTWWILIECRSGVSSWSSFTQNIKSRWFDVNNMWLELARP